MPGSKTNDRGVKPRCDPHFGRGGSLGVSKSHRSLLKWPMKHRMRDNHAFGGWGSHLGIILMTLNML